MNKHIKTIFKVCGITGLICVLCILCCLPFVNFKDNKAIVHADTVSTDYSYEGSNIPLTCSFYDNTVISPQSTGFTLYNLNLSITLANYHDTGLAFHINGFILNSNFVSSEISCNSLFPVFDSWELAYLINPSSNGRFIFHYYYDSAFNCNVVSVNIRTQLWGGTNTSIAQTVIDYVDNENHYCRFYFFGNFNATDSYSNIASLSRNNIIFYAPRTYYLTNSLADNEYFLQGQNYGEQIGVERGFKDGRSKGYAEGKKDGIEIGKELGSDYSFVSFYTGLFDAPVAMVYNALDFEILGINLYTFFCGLITVFLCLALIKFIRGK